MGTDVLVCTSYEVAVFQGVVGQLVDKKFGLVQFFIGYEGDRWLGRAVCFGSYQEARGVGVAGACGGITEGDRTGCVPGM